MSTDSSLEQGFSTWVQIAACSLRSTSRSLPFSCKDQEYSFNHCDMKSLGKSLACRSLSHPLRNYCVQNFEIAYFEDWIAGTAVTTPQELCPQRKQKDRQDPLLAEDRQDPKQANTRHLPVIFG